MTDSRLASFVAQMIYKAFSDYDTRFKDITRQAEQLFESQDWQGMQKITTDRLNLYKEIVADLLTKIHDQLGDRVESNAVWMGSKAVYSVTITDCDNWELAETFFNSITRRIFTTVGVNPQIEFVDTDFETPPNASQAVLYHSASSTRKLVETILLDYQFQTPYENLSRDVQLVSAKIESHLRKIGALYIVERTQILKPCFYRGNAAYLIGRMFSGSHMIPFVVVVLNTPAGIAVDAVLLEENEVSIAFSFAYSYFHVLVDRPYDLVYFLKSIIPRKKVAELYISIGYNRHGKTELYRTLLQHVRTADEQFEIAPGTLGMVMTAFVLPSYDVVFKVIKDKFDRPKKTRSKKNIASSSNMTAPAAWWTRKNSSISNLRKRSSRIGC